MKQHMRCLCGKESIYTWRNKLVPLEVWVGREGRRKEGRLGALRFREEMEQGQRGQDEEG